MQKRLYLDYAASTPVDPRVFEVMQPYFSEKFGNPGSLHSFGQEAIGAVDKARETIAKLIGCDFRQVIFTASATEANNLGLRGILRVVRQTSLKNPKIIISAIEHESVLETARDLSHEGIDVVYVPVDPNGCVDPKGIAGMIDGQTVLISLMHANNEIGTIQPIKAIAEAIAEYKKANASPKNLSPYPLLHTDAAQTTQFLDCNIETLGVDVMTLSSHKMYGPKGAGALYIKNTKLCMPLITGGGQEFGFRSGTENVPAIVGFAKAFELAVEGRDAEAERIRSLKDALWQKIKNKIPNAEINGVAVAGSGKGDAAGAGNALPNILNVYFPGHDSQDLLTKFDLAGLAASSGSACHSRAVEPSYVIPALGYNKERAQSSIRFSLGRPTTDSDIVQAAAVITDALKA